MNAAMCDSSRAWPGHCGSPAATVDSALCTQPLVCDAVPVFCPLLMTQPGERITDAAQGAARTNPLSNRRACWSHTYTPDVC